MRGGRRMRRGLLSQSASRAAAVAVNEDRELLLVKRKYPPEQGRWCLPIGFAELDETIEEAASASCGRRLCEGRVRACWTSIYGSEFYGDLLIVTFEIERTGGNSIPEMMLRTPHISPWTGCCRWLSVPMMGRQGRVS